MSKESAVWPPAPERGTVEPDEPRVIGLNGELADEVFKTLKSPTTREIVSIIYEQPSTPTEIRDKTGSSLQNVHYHLRKLEDADLIQPSGMGYSRKGTEMTVYAPASEAVVLCVGDDTAEDSVVEQ